MRFDIESSDRDGTRRIAVAGELDVATAPSLNEALAQAEAGDARVIVVDLADVSFIDSTGLHAILAAHARSQRNGNRLCLARCSEPVERLFELTGARDRLPFLT
jgi:anti-sigma B factor antagonist